MKKCVYLGLIALVMIIGNHSISAGDIARKLFLVGKWNDGWNGNGKVNLDIKMDDSIKIDYYYKEIIGKIIKEDSTKKTIDVELNYNGKITKEIWNYFLSPDTNYLVIGGLGVLSLKEEYKELSFKRW